MWIPCFVVPTLIPLPYIWAMRLKSNDIRWKYPSISSLLRGSVCRNRWVFSIYWKDSLGGGYTKLRGKKALHNLKKFLSLVSILCDLKKNPLSLLPIPEPGKPPALPLPGHRAWGSPSYIQQQTSMVFVVFMTWAASNAFLKCRILELAPSQTVESKSTFWPDPQMML